MLFVEAIHWRDILWFVCGVWTFVLFRGLLIGAACDARTTKPGSRGGAAAAPQRGATSSPLLDSDPGARFALTTM